MRQGANPRRCRTFPIKKRQVADFAQPSVSASGTRDVVEGGKHFGVLDKGGNE
jgi:hypothetical protein